jgi:hypothetical protein
MMKGRLIRYRMEVFGSLAVSGSVCWLEVFGPLAGFFRLSVAIFSHHSHGRVTLHVVYKVSSTAHYFAL